MRNQYNEQLKELHEQMIHMGNLCEEAISAAAVSIMGRTPGGRERAYHADEQIDKMERQIEGSVSSPAFTAAAGGRRSA